MVNILVCYEARNRTQNHLAGHGFFSVEKLDEASLNWVRDFVAKEVLNKKGLGEFLPSEVILRSVTRLDESTTARR